MSSRSWLTSVWNCCLDIASLIMTRSGSEVKKGRAGVAGTEVRILRRRRCRHIWHEVPEACTDAFFAGSSRCTNCAPFASRQRPINTSAAIRRLAYEASDCGLLSPDLAAGMRRVKGVRLLGVRVGNWLTAEEGLLPARPGTVGLIIRFLFIGRRVCSVS